MIEAMIIGIFLPLLQQLPPPEQTAQAAQQVTAQAVTLGSVNIHNFMLVSGLLFIVGIAGVLTRRNLIIILMSIELMLNAANLNLIAFSRYWQTQGSSNSYMGQMFTVFVIVVAAAEAAIGLGILIAFYRNRETIAVDEINIMRW